MPYWDWANVATMPDFLSAQYITVNTSIGPRSIVNPLNTYTFHDTNGNPAHPSVSDFPAGGIVSSQILLEP
jgi:hypothetical protein